MSEMLTVTTERVDDIPVLQAQMQVMGLPLLLDRHFPRHGNWQGLSLGWLVTGWLTHIVSQGDHRLNHVEPWAERRQQTLERSMGQAVRVLDFSDDRLESGLVALSDDARWSAFEMDLNGQLLRVYDLTPEQVRLDSSSASGYWRVTEEGLFQFGHSKDHRPDLPQVKVMLAALDPLGLPLVTTVLSGERADDPLYIPAVRQVRASLDRRGLLYIGDCKMAALDTRAFVHAEGDFYLCPLSATQLSAEALESYLEPVWETDGPLRLTPIYREQANAEQKLIAEGYERLESLSATVDGRTLTWTERRLVVRSMQHAQAAEVALQARLKQAVQDIMRLNVRKRGKQCFTEVEALRQAAESIVARHQVQGLVRLSYTEQVDRRPVRRYRDRPAGFRETRRAEVYAQIDQAGVQAAVRRMGWRVYATDQSAAQLSLQQAILAYHNEYLIEHAFSRLKGRPLSLTPMYLQQEAHIKGLIRVLSIGLRVLTLLEFTIRQRLATQKAELTGLYAGNPKRATARPTAERLLEAFQEITLAIIQEAHQTRRHLTPLSNLQRRILELLDFSPAIYTKLRADSVEPP
jgi:transposase